MVEILYNTDTKKIHSHGIGLAPFRDNQAVASIDDSYIPTLLIEGKEKFYLGSTNIDVRDPESPPPTPDEIRAQIPDPGGLMLAVYQEAPTGLGMERALAINRDFGVVLWALQAGNWPLVRQSVETMLSTGFISQLEYNRLQELMTEYRIPVA